ncbi:glycine betaine ABC transporter substrate-binding protein [Streptomyces echinatus]|uniref:glycine betaine ABC transporter substrate-binding protein n=1 Tax=Streptomyces echinatus TaxID=67293 RepID=UPI0038062781
MTARRDAARVAWAAGSSIDGINPGAGISRFSAHMVRHYGLDRHGYTFVPGTERSFIDRVERGIAAGEWFVIPIGRPQYLNLLHGLRPLTEPMGLLSGVDRCQPLRLPRRRRSNMTLEVGFVCGLNGEVIEFIKRPTPKA